MSQEPNTQQILDQKKARKIVQKDPVERVLEDL